MVAVSALLVAVQGGHQGAFMAPTEVLAEQHAVGVRAAARRPHGARRRATPLRRTGPLRVELLTNRTTGSRAPAHRWPGWPTATVDLVIGTHALIQEGVAFRSLGVVVIDEQHRFGVEQRAALRDKSGRRHVPDVLVMTATPIPRTAAMTVYGDLDVVGARRAAAGAHADRDRRGPTGRSTEEAERGPTCAPRSPTGRQAYVVCPLIEESEKLEVRVGRGDVRAARAPASWPGCASACCTAGCRRPRRRRSWAAFRAGELDVLVATTVIEVGVDVPNATVMVILDADRFGIAQLHQLRGRVGRGPSAASTAASLGDERRRPTASARARGAGATPPTASSWPRSTSTCGARARSSDTAQKGRNDLKLASLRRDRELVAQAREVGVRARRRGPGPRATTPSCATSSALFFDEEDEEFLFKS